LGGAGGGALALAALATGPSPMTSVTVTAGAACVASRGTVDVGVERTGAARGLPRARRRPGSKRRA
jgi:hypothetical protein